LFVRETLAPDGAFRAFALFDEALDCIRVVTRDCSVNEIRVDELLTLLEANHPSAGKPELVGFTIKGIAHICETQGISPDAPWRLADFLDAIVANSKVPYVRYTVDADLRPLIEAARLEEVEPLAPV